MKAPDKLQVPNLKWHFRPRIGGPSLVGLSNSTASRDVAMTKLRQGRWLEAFSEACSTKSSWAAAALTGAMLLPGALWGAPVSHSRHPLPTSLHTAHVIDTSSHGGGKTRKGGLKSRTGTDAGGAAAKHGTTARQGGKRGSKGRSRRTEPVDDPVPMFRADRGVHGAYDVASTRRDASHHRQHGAFASEPAPLVSSWRHGHAVPAGAAHGPARASYPEYASVSSARAAGSHISTPAGRRTPAVAEVAPAARYAGPSRAAAAPASAYAMGVAHPDDDERMPRARGGADSDSGAIMNAAPTGVITAAPSLPTVVLPHQPPVVQGFGSEVAVPAGNGSGDRPGGTRRRSHPSTWTPEPTSLNAEPLDEREAITEAAVLPAVLPELYDRSGHLVMRAPLKGSHDVLVHQNIMADSDGLERAQNDADLERMRAAHLLVSLPASESLHVNEDLPANRRVARPWTVMFATDIGRAFYQRFHEPIYVTSAVRTVQYQARLQMVNGNAAGLWGDTASPHLTGQAIDMAKRGMSAAQLAWMRGYLQPLMQAGKIDVEEEFHQACFHVSVYRSYAAGRRVLQHEVAQVRPAAGPVQADTADTPDAQ